LQCGGGQQFPDFLSIDIEGMDFDVLKTLDYNKSPIPVICAETSVFDFRKGRLDGKILSIHELLSQTGYFVYADTYINTIFVKKDWFYSSS
jgi:hypothetical protein